MEGANINPGSDNGGAIFAIALIIAIILGAFVMKLVDEFTNDEPIEIGIPGEDIQLTDDSSTDNIEQNTGPLSAPFG